MDGFLSFLNPSFNSDNPEILSSEEDFDIMDAQITELIHTWLRQYIDMYNPGYTFDEVAKNIWSVVVTDENIDFTLFNPHLKIHETFGFWINILEKIQAETRESVGKICYDSGYLENKIFSISPETLSIVHSWIPEIPPERIIAVNIMPFDNGKEDFEYDSQHDHLEVSYYGPNNDIKSRRLPNIFKGEYQSTSRGLTHSLKMERSKIIRLLTQKK